MMEPISPQPRGPVRRLVRKALRNWRERHQQPFNFAIHLLGIPLAVAGVPVLFFYPWWGVGAIVVGYLLQFIGHAVEGNDVGEWAAIKRMLGLPYVGVAPNKTRTEEGLPSSVLEHQRSRRS